MTLIYVRVNKPTWDNNYAVGALSAVTRSDVSYKTKWEPKTWVYEDWVLLKIEKS